jgi:hypothetical protein
MAKRKKNGRTAKNNPNATMLGSTSLYRTKDTHPRTRKENSKAIKDELTADMNRASKEICKGQHMAKVEAYAKEHKCTITQAMIALMP